MNIDADLANDILSIVINEHRISHIRVARILRIDYRTAADAMGEMHENGELERDIRSYRATPRLLRLMEGK